MSKKKFRKGIYIGFCIGIMKKKKNNFRRKDKNYKKFHKGIYIGCCIGIMKKKKKYQKHFQKRF